MKFIADRMLGRLAKWMRGLGLDVYYDASIDRSSLFRIAKEEDRLILTRAHNFSELKHIPSYIQIESEIPEEQLEEFVSKVKNLESEIQMFTRCMECNELLEDISKSEVKDLVPPKAYDMHDHYKRCPTCKRVYWEGTHVTRMRKLFESIKPHRRR